MLLREASEDMDVKDAAAHTLASMVLGVRAHSARAAGIDVYKCYAEWKGCRICIYRGNKQSGMSVLTYRNDTLSGRSVGYV